MKTYFCDQGQIESDHDGGTYLWKIYSHRFKCQFGNLADKDVVRSNNEIITDGIVWNEEWNTSKPH